MVLCRATARGLKEKLLPVVSLVIVRLVDKQTTTESPGGI